MQGHIIGAWRVEAEHVAVLREAAVWHDGVVVLVHAGAVVCHVCEHDALVGIYRSVGREYLHCKCRSDEYERKARICNLAGRIVHYQLYEILIWNCEGYCIVVHMVIACRIEAV